MADKLKVSDQKTADQLFRLDGRVAVITGGAGMLGLQHAEAIAEMGGRPVLLDIHPQRMARAVEHLSARFGASVSGHVVDITDRQALARTVEAIIGQHGAVDILINNAAMTVTSDAGVQGYFAPVEEYPLEMWERALRVSLTGAFVCCQVIGRHMKERGGGVILNIASDAGVISPDHRIYQPNPADGYPGVPFNTPPSYAVAKAGLIHLTRYLATYWAREHIRVNALSPAGVFKDHDERFVRRLTQLIPMGRMAHQDEYKGAIVFLVSDASAFMTGCNVLMDGGRTCW